ncbi:MAG: phosphopantetheine adenylyltransferase [Chloroflexota bacterium]|jgi:pantetheine-phosphate adenylyltransferase|nr:pantetheine-phosphate adenylyltransferase [Caldilinea sp.]GIK74811.1 MAG: phosphopantetheine adenylyltransferase [Chloroflexota bacterium]
MARALYPGTFDPIHNGHIDIAVRASVLFDEVVLAIYDAPPKKLLFDTRERFDLAVQALEHLPNLRIVTYSGLTVECAREHKADVIVRGLRNVADFEYEQQIGWANAGLAPELELCCLFCSSEYAYLSATILKEVAHLGGECSAWAPSHVLEALSRKFDRPIRSGSPKIYLRREEKLVHHD